MWVYDTSPIAGTISSNVSNYHAYNFGGGYTHVFTPNLLLDVRGGAMLKPYVFTQAFSPIGFTGATQAGFQNVGQYGGMYINLASPYTTSNSGSESDLYRGNPVVNVGGSVSYLLGRHSLKAGGDYMYQNRLQRNLYQQFTFSDAITSNINASNTGNSLASSLPRLSRHLHRAAARPRRRLLQHDPLGRIHHRLMEGQTEPDPQLRNPL